MCFTKTDISCFGANDGEIHLDVTGGAPPYSYEWAHGPTDSILTGLSKGSYSVTVRDNAGDSLMVNFNILEPEELEMSFDVTDVACFGDSTGAIYLSGSGGTFPFFYEWDDGTLSQDRTGLLAGTYAVQIVDANGCAVSDSVAVNQPAFPLSITSISIEHETYPGANDGAIVSNYSGGQPPYEFAWAHGATSQWLSGLSAGNYSLTVTDDNGCTLNLDTTITTTEIDLSLIHI